MINQSDTSNTIYDITSLPYWDSGSLNKEIDRVYDICIGCRLCFNLCPSFPFLFNAVDQAGDRKREEAVAAGRVQEEEKAKENLNLPEFGSTGSFNHAVQASIEAEFRGEVSDLTEAQRWRIVDLCYQCKLCEGICPYTPDKEHEFKLDFPKLILRAQAIRTKDRGIKMSDRFLSNTDIIGRLGTFTAPLANWGNTNKFLRWLMQLWVGIHKDRILPRFHFQTLKRWYKRHRKEVLPPQEPIDRVVIFGTCFVNYNDPNVGKAAIAILEHNQVEVVYPPQRCCGAPYLTPGDLDGFRKQAEPNLRELAAWVDEGYKIVVTGPPTCSLTLKKEYPYILGHDPEAAPLAQKVSENTSDISEFLIYLHKQGKLNTHFKHEIGTVNYHMSCHLKAQNMGFKSRDLLRLVPNTKIRIVTRCSGMDGGWGMKAEFFEESVKVGKKCVKELEKRDADVTCSDCTLAGLQIYHASDKRINPEHPVETLHRAYGLGD